MTDSALRIAVVGSGPSGTYTAQALCELADERGFDLGVDVYERLPVPFGLVRYGVAPDHQKIKTVVGTFEQVYADTRVNFHGNVTVGRDITIPELADSYSAVVVAAGAAMDRRLDIPGEDAAGVWSATEFVAWYSGHPDARVGRFALEAEHAVIVGVGNVALDVARILCRTPDEMRATDVPEHVVDILAASRIREVRMVGRRGMEHAKFSARELDELNALVDTELLVDPRDVPEDPSRLAPVTRRMIGVLAGFDGQERADARRTIRFDFARRPAAVIGDPIRAVDLSSTAHPDLAPEPVAAELLIRSVGYRAEPFPGLPFDKTTHTVPHEAGRVVDEEGARVDGLYVVGWIKRGPSGIIGTNRMDAVETVTTLVADLAENPRAAGPRPSHRSALVVGWDGWRRIDAAEERYGAGLGRGRVKLHDRKRLLAAAESEKQERM